jgi:hypothetical protein
MEAAKTRDEGGAGWSLRAFATSGRNARRADRVDSLALLPRHSLIYRNSESGEITGSVIRNWDVVQPVPALAPDQARPHRSRLIFHTPGTGPVIRSNGNGIMKPALTISPEKVAYIIVKAKEFDAKDVLTDPGDSSDATDDKMMSVLEDHANDPVRDELVSFINDLDDDEQVDLVALAWLGREDNSQGDWTELHAEARRAHNKRTAAYLLGMPLLGDFLADGLATLGYDPEQYESDLS